MRQIAAVILVLALIPWAQPGTAESSSYVVGDEFHVEPNPSVDRTLAFAPNPGYSHCDSKVYDAPGSNEARFQLTSAGQWRIHSVLADGSSSNETFHVNPLLFDTYLQAHRRPDTLHQPDLVDFSFQTLLQGQTLPRATLQLWHNGVPVLQLATDDAGQAWVTAERLPYTGPYDLKGFRDLDAPIVENIDGTGAADACNGARDVADAISQGTISNSGHELYRPTIAGVTTITRGDHQVQGVPGQTHVAFFSPGGTPLTVDAVYVENGATGGHHARYDNTVVFHGDWPTAGQVQFRLVNDPNGDGVPEYEATAVIAVRSPGPVRFVGVNDALSYTVPAPHMNRPGEHDLLFRALDVNNTYAKPPLVEATDFTIHGDLLQTPRIEYDAQQDAWRVHATPKNSDSDYSIDLYWPGVGSATLHVELPQEAGARSSRLNDTVLVASSTVDIQLFLERFNPDHRVYEPVVDGRVTLAYADTGEVLTWFDGQQDHAYTYEPGDPWAGCRLVRKCLEHGGIYRFEDVLLPRAGPLVAIHEIGQSRPEYSYTDLFVEPANGVQPSFQPGIVSHSKPTRFLLQADPILSRTNFDNVTIRVLDGDGVDITRSLSFGFEDEQVFTMLEPRNGPYRLFVDDRIDAARNQYGNYTTRVPGLLQVVPVAVSSSYEAVVQYNATLPDPNVPSLTTNVLGAGLGDIRRVRFTATGTDAGNPIGDLVIQASASTYSPSAAAALLAVAPDQSPSRIHAPYFFPPDLPFWAAAAPGASSYYLPGISDAVEFSTSIRVPYNGKPVDVLVWGIHEGHITYEFHWSTASAPGLADGNIDVVSPHLAVHRVVTDLGVVPNATALPVGTPLAATIAVRDPLGISDFPGVRAGLFPSAAFDPLHWIFGPATGPGGPLGNHGNGTWTTRIAGTLEHTGMMQGAVIKENGASATPLFIPVVPRSHTEFLDPSDSIVVDAPSNVTIGDSFEVHVELPFDPFTNDAQVSFQNTTKETRNGTVRFTAVNEQNATAGAVPLTVTAPDYPPQTLWVRVTPRIVNGTDPGGPTSPPTEQPAYPPVKVTINPVFDPSPDAPYLVKPTVLLDATNQLDFAPFNDVLRAALGSNADHIPVDARLIVGSRNQSVRTIPLDTPLEVSFPILDLRWQSNPLFIRLESNGTTSAAPVAYPNPYDGLLNVTWPVTDLASNASQSTICFHQEPLAPPTFSFGPYNTTVSQLGDKCWSAAVTYQGNVLEAFTVLAAWEAGEIYVHREIMVPMGLGRPL